MDLTLMPAVAHRLISLEADWWCSSSHFKALLVELLLLNYLNVWVVIIPSTMLLVWLLHATSIIRNL